jgi:hypothetical protein
MSTILKALRRLEEQKSAATQRPLRDEVVLAPGRKSRRTGIVLGIAAAIAFALVGAALVALFDRVPGTGAPQAEAPVAAIDVAAPPEAEIAIAEEAATEFTVAAPEPNLRGIEVPPVVPIPASEPDFEIVRPESRPRPLIPEMQVDRAPAEGVAVARPGSARPRPIEPEPEPILEEEIVLEEEIGAPEPVARATAPVRVERTQWHPSPDRRVAWVEVEGTTALREVREGERIGPYVVRSIEPAAVLFSEGSVRVRREVGR